MIFAGLWATLLIPFYVANTMFFPYITGKNFAFRIIIEIIFGLWVYLAYIDEKYRPKFSWVTISVAVFVFIMAIADFFAVNPTKAFFSNFERMDGWITLIHLLMYLLVFGAMMKTEKIWMWFFRSFAICSVIMSGLAIHEYILTKDRVAGPLGNADYLALYFVFGVFITLILLYKDVIAQGYNSFIKFFSNWLTYIYVIVAGLSLYGLWLTGTRGAIIGFLGGLIVAAIIVAIFEKQNIFLKYSAWTVLVIIFVLIGGFLSIKNTTFVKNNQTLERFATISWSAVQGEGQARQYVWAMAIKGIKEKPVLGWGQEGFNYVFNKYYDPRMYSQEQWFDRAHDTPLDVAVAGGILGLIAYLSIFVAVLWLAWKRRKQIGVMDSALLVGLLAAYFAQNIFIFDNLSSYLLFYMVLAYVYSQDIANREIALPSKNTKHVPNPDIANYIIAPILIVILGTTIWYFNYKPIEANRTLIASMQQQSEGVTQNLQLFQDAIAMNTFGTPEIREQLVNITPQIVQSSSIDTSVKQNFADFTYTQMQDQVAHTPLDARYQLFAGVFLDNMQQYQLASAYLQKAVSLSPTKQTIIAELVKNESYLGQYDQALALAEKEYNLDTSDTDAQSDYVAALVLNGKESTATQLFGASILTGNQSVTRSYLILASADLAKNDKTDALAEVNKAIAANATFKTQGQGIITGIQNGTVK